MVPRRLHGSYTTLFGRDHANLGPLRHPYYVRSVHAELNCAFSTNKGGARFCFQLDRAAWGTWPPAAARPHVPEILFATPWLQWRRRVQDPHNSAWWYITHDLDTYHDGIILPPCTQLFAALDDTPPATLIGHVEVTVDGFDITHGMFINPRHYAHDPVHA